MIAKLGKQNVHFHAYCLRNFFSTTIFSSRFNYEMHFKALTSNSHSSAIDNTLLHIRLAFFEHFSEAKVLSIIRAFRNKS